MTAYVPADVADALQRMAAVQDRTVSAAVAEVLEEMGPTFRDVAELGEAFEAASESQRLAVRAGVAESEVRVGPHVEALVREFRALMGGLEGQTPDTSNTGVR